MARYRRYAFPSARRWQDLREMRSRATGSGKILPRCVLGRSTMAECSRNAFPSVRRWQDCALMRSWSDRQWQYTCAVRSRGSCRGKIPPRCVPGCSTMAKCSRNALPSVRRWQDCALMRSWSDWQWQYSCAMRSRALCRGNISPRCVPGRQSVAIFSLHVSQKGPRTRKGGGFVARFARRASKTSWLWQDVRAMHPKSPANRRWRIHRANILPGRGPFRCTNPSNHARRADLAIIRRMRGKDRAENAYVLSKTEPESAH